MRPVFLPFPPASLATTVRLCGWFLDNLRLGVHAWSAQRDRQVEGCMPTGMQARGKIWQEKLFRAWYKLKLIRVKKFLSPNFIPGQTKRNRQYLATRNLELTLPDKRGVENQIC